VAGYLEQPEVIKNIKLIEPEILNLESMDPITQEFRAKRRVSKQIREYFF
jgi:hypothetical protein